MIGVYSFEDLKVLRQIQGDISFRLGVAFSSDQIMHFSTGGLFGVKEVLLFSLVRKFRPALIVETGVSQGISTYVLLKAIELNKAGKLISVDLPNRNPAGFANPDGSVDSTYTPLEFEPGWLVPDQLRSFWHLRLGKSSEVLPSIRDGINVLFHDSEH